MSRRRGGPRGEAGAIADAFERDAQLSSKASLRASSVREMKSMVESEIVIVDDDGNEEPFDPSTWFE
jgi:hypothetical protein